MLVIPSTKIWAVVPSAGIGVRMRDSIPKQYLEIQGRAVIEHTIATLLAEECIRKITVCIAESDSFWSKLDIASNPRVSSTIGGATRAHSVLNGIKAISDKAQDNDWVLVHDAARPCLSQLLLGSFIEQLKANKVGGILAIPSNDTVKLAKSSDSGDTIEKTLDRKRVWYAQTPQMFRYGLLKEALQVALESGAEVTDEASAIEMMGHEPRLINGEVRNIKITQIDDLEMASLLMAQADNIDESK